MFSARVHARPGSPIAAFTATLTPTEKEKVIKVAGKQGEMIVIAEGPISNQGKICILKRPTSQCPFKGKTTESGKWVPGLQQLLQLLVLDRFVELVKRGPPFEGFHRTIIFFRSADHMAFVHSYLSRKTGLR